MICSSSFVNLGSAIFLLPTTIVCHTTITVVSVKSFFVGRLQCDLGAGLGAYADRLRDFNLTRNPICLPNPKVMPSMSRERRKQCELDSCCWRCLCLRRV